MSESINQQAKVLKLLRKAGKRGVPNYIFPQHRILRLSSVVFELRKDGYNIQLERVILPNGRATQVWKYFLVEEK